MSFNIISKSIIPFVSIIVIVPTLFIPAFSNTSNLEISPELLQGFNISGSIFYWPVPGYTRISSYFGKRNSPTAGASSFHQGIDIPAPSGTSLVSIFNGIVSYIGFNGSGGYAIHIENNDLQFIYHHVSPNYIVKIGDYVYSRSNYWTSRS